MDDLDSVKLEIVSPSDMTKLKRFSKVHIRGFEGKVLNPVYDKWWDENGVMHDNGICGYRVTDGKRPAFWIVVPNYLIEELDV